MLIDSSRRRTITQEFREHMSPFDKAKVMKPVYRYESSLACFAAASDIDFDARVSPQVRLPLLSDFRPPIMMQIVNEIRKEEKVYIPLL